MGKKGKPARLIRIWDRKFVGGVVVHRGMIIRASAPLRWTIGRNWGRVRQLLRKTGKIMEDFK